MIITIMYRNFITNPVEISTIAVKKAWKMCRNFNNNFTALGPTLRDSVGNGTTAVVPSSDDDGASGRRCAICPACG